MMDYNLLFIEKKLTEIKTAVMHIEGDHVVKLPNDVVEFLRVDEAGRLWVAAHKPRCRLRTYEQCFPVQFSFYRKGIPFFIHLTGTAMIGGIEDNSLVEDKLVNGSYLVKVTPHMLEYRETGKKAGIGETWWGIVTRWLSTYLPTAGEGQLTMTGVQKQ
jgi:hypothetical protein